MSSSADREPPQDANPYRSPTHSGWADDPVALLQEFPGGAIEVRGSLQPKDVILAHFGDSCGFTGLAFRQLMAAAFVLLVGAGLCFAILPDVINQSEPRVLLWLILVLLEGGLFLLLVTIRRDWVSAKYLRQLWNQRRGIFADQLRRVTVQGIISTSPDEHTETPWDDYAHYRLTGNRLRLHLRRKARQRRRSQRPEGGILWKAGKRWYDGIDIFPRDQFASREEWQLFVRLVRKKLRKG